MHHHSRKDLFYGMVVYLHGFMCIVCMQKLELQIAVSCELPEASVGIRTQALLEE